MHRKVLHDLSKMAFGHVTMIPESRLVPLRSITNKIKLCGKQILTYCLELGTGDLCKFDSKQPLGSDKTGCSL